MSGLSNIDTASLETLKQFKAFFEMVQNPQSFVKIIEDADKTVAEMKTVIEAYTTVELANEYLTKAKTFANEKVTEIETKTQNAQEAASKRQAQIEEQRVAAEQTIAQANQVMKEAQAFKEQLDFTNDALQKQKASLEALREQLNTQQTNILLREKELNVKAAKLKEIVG